MSEEVQRRFFEQLARRYDSRFCRSRWPRNQELKTGVIRRELGSALTSGPVVELGCGTAQIAATMLESQPEIEYVGLDLSPGMLEVARRRLPAGAELRAVEGPLPLEAGRFAAAFGVDVLHHIDDPVQVLRELREALRPGAPVVFLEPNPRFPLTAALGVLQREERHVLKIGFRNLRRWFEQAGLTDVRVEYGPLYTPPGPAVLSGALDRIDAALARVPLVRGLAIFYVARGSAP